MAIKKKDKSKVVVHNAADTYLDVRVIFKKEGGRNEDKSTRYFYDVFHTKNRVTVEEFNKPELAVEFIEKHFPKYNKKEKKFKFK